MINFGDLVDELLVAYTIWVVVASTSGIGTQTGPPSKQIESVLEKITEIVTSRQNYSFAATMRPLPAAVRELGWILDAEVKQASRFLAALKPPVSVDSVYELSLIHISEPTRL